MADEQKKEEGGADADSRKAGARLAAAVAANDADEIREAVFDQNAALINQSMVQVIPTLKNVLETVLQTELGKISMRLDNHSRADLDRRTEESERRQAQETYLYSELDTLRQGQQQIPAAVREVVASELEKLNPRIEEIEAGQAVLKAQVSDLGEEVNTVKMDVKEIRTEFGSRLSHVEAELGDVKGRVMRIEQIVQLIAKEGGAAEATRVMLEEWERTHPPPDLGVKRA